MALVSACCWAGFDVARKHIGKDMTATAAVAGVMLMEMPFILPFLGITEAGMAPEQGNPLVDLVFSGIPSPGIEYAALLGASITLNLLANFLFLRAVQLSPLSLTTPYLSFTPVFTALTGFIFFSEQPTAVGLVGILVVCLGAFFLNPGNKDEGILAPLKALWTERGSFYMLVVAVIWSITPPIDKAASTRTSFLWHTGSLALGIGVMFAAGRIWKDGNVRELWEELKLHPGWLAISGFFAFGAMVLQLASYEFVDMAYVETVKRAVGVTAAMLAGWLFFGEKDIGQRLLGAAVMVLGVALVVFEG